MTTVSLRHGLVTLAVHTVRTGDGPGLLLLHGLGEQSPSTVPSSLESWPGPVHSLDFTGHGASTRPLGGGYTAEQLMADADAALAHLGPMSICGRGLGAYIALLIAGARHELVLGAILCDGPGLAGGPIGPSSPTIVEPPPDSMVSSPDPFALVELARDVRPGDYASAFARLALSLAEVPHPLIVCAKWKPVWLQSVVDEPGVVELDLAQALERLAADRFMLDTASLT